MNSLRIRLDDEVWSENIIFQLRQANMELFIAWIFYGPVYGAFSKNSTYDHHPRYYSNDPQIYYCLYPMNQYANASADKYRKT